MQVNVTNPGNIPVAPAHGCCSKKNIDSQRWIQVLSEICRVALAVFAYVVQPTWFGVSFAVGLGLSFFHAIWTKGGDGVVGALRPICGQGYMEFLSGKSFPLWTVYVVTTAFIAAHVRHDPIFFVPFTGLFLGWKAGATAYNLGQRMIPVPPSFVKSCCMTG